MSDASDRLRHALAVRNMSIRRLFLALRKPEGPGTSYTALHRYISAKAEPSLSVVVATARILDVSFVWLATGHGDMDASSADADDLRGYDERRRSLARQLAEAALSIHADEARAVLR